MLLRYVVLLAALLKDQCPSRSVETVNVLDILMAGQRRLCMPSLPNRVEERNRKDKLFNDLISLLESIGKKWPSSEVQSGKSFLTNVLWYIDGHHETFEAQGCHIPELFKPFTGYNKPELSPQNSSL